MISKEQVAHVAKLSRLQFTDTELTEFTNQLDRIIEMEDHLAQIDTTGVPLTTQVVDEVNVFREDEPQSPVDRDRLFANAPDADKGFIKVPAILDKGEADA